MRRRGKLTNGLQCIRKDVQVCSEFDRDPVGLLQDWGLIWWNVFWKWPDFDLVDACG